MLDTLLREMDAAVTEEALTQQSHGAYAAAVGAIMRAGAAVEHTALEEFVADDMWKWFDVSHIQDLLRACQRLGWTTMQDNLACLLQQLFEQKQLQLAVSLLDAMTAFDSGGRCSPPSSSFFFQLHHS